MFNPRANAQPRPGTPWNLPPESGLHRTWGFRLAVLAILTLTSKYVAVFAHGLVGVFILAALSVLVMNTDGTVRAISAHVRRNTARNQWLVLMNAWYLLGVLYKAYFTGAEVTEWRFVMEPVIIQLGLLFAFAYLHDVQCARWLQIALIVTTGAQCLFSGSVIMTDYEYVRRSVVDTGGGWQFGDPFMFALYAMMLPVLIWRSCVEKGALRVVLLLCCASTVRTVLICQFGTPVGLLLIGIAVLVVLAGMYLRRGSLALSLLLVAAIVGGSVYIGWRLRDSSLFATARNKIERAYEDPRSGGYRAGREADEGSRWLLAQISTDSFKEHPFIGAGRGMQSNSPVVGGHSSFFDALGFSGLLGGGGAFAMLVLMSMARAYTRMRRYRDWATIVAATTAVMLFAGGVVNPYWRGGSIVMVLLLGRLFRLPEERV